MVEHAIARLRLFYDSSLFLRDACFRIDGGCDKDR
jgi:hypothetical protein